MCEYIAIYVHSGAGYAGNARRAGMTPVSSRLADGDRR